MRFAERYINVIKGDYFAGSTQMVVDYQKSIVEESLKNKNETLEPGSQFAPSRLSVVTTR